VTGSDEPLAADEPGAKAFYGIVPVFLVDDLVPTVEYYRDVLGFEVDYVYGDPPNYGSVSRGGAVLQFTRSNPPGRRNSVLRAGPGNGVDAYVVVTDVDSLHDEFTAKGALIHTFPASHEYGMREFKIEDFNGYIIVFAEEIDV
jgi:catechol 2,3-dioxygenase-like lactoylglutathione lyase family enzyme